MNEIILNRKTLNGLGSRINDNAKGSEISSFAKRQMAKMGWEEGKGLGRSENGMITHIKAKKLLDSEGIGAKEARIENDNSDTTWWHDGFANALQNMKSNKRKHSKKEKKDKKSKKEKSTSSTTTGTGINYDELFKATGGARLGMRARGEQSGKFKRSEALNTQTKETDIDIENSDKIVIEIGNCDESNTGVDEHVDVTSTEIESESEVSEPKAKAKKSKKSDKKEKKEKKEKKSKKTKD